MGGKNAEGTSEWKEAVRTHGDLALEQQLFPSRQTIIMPSSLKHTMLYKAFWPPILNCRFHLGKKTKKTKTKTETESRN